MDVPAEFSKQIKALLKNESDAFFNALQQEAPTSIRINKDKTKELPDYEPVKWNNEGYYLPSRPSFTFDPLFHSGCYYPQEAASMFLSQVITQFVDSDVRVLDLCAAPGGKSTLLLSLLSTNSLLVSNEVIRSRANILSENICKWGSPNVIVTNNDPSDIGKLTHYFDVILVDAPCSGEGMFRKDIKSINEWSPSNIRLCSERQKRILRDIWNALAPGGLLIYSTCTYNTVENEESVKWIASELKAEILRMEIPDSWNISGAINTDIPAYRFFPYKTKGEGLFMAVLRKNSAENSFVKKQKNKTENKKPKLPDAQRNFLLPSTEFEYYSVKNTWHAFPKNLTEELSYLKNLSVVSSGITIGEQKGKDFIPSQSLIMSKYLDQSAFITHNIDWQTAISYLRKETIILPPSIPKGLILLTYRNTPLGLVKNIGNRANNLYTQEWRIRSNNVPDKEVIILR